MAILPIAHAEFPGIQTGNILAASIDVVHGIWPSVAVLTIIPQPEIPTLIGTLTFTSGKGVPNEVTLSWPKARINEASFQRNDRGEVWQLSIFDRRWKWAYGSIWGRYNIRKDDGSLVGWGTSKSSERTPQELARLCLDAMRETSYDVGLMPNDLRPEVDWDFDNPAEALADLCDQVSCRVVLGLDNRVRIHPAGVGAYLPIVPEVMDNSVNRTPPVIPDQLAIATAKCRYQSDLLLEAVGKDLDGSIKPIDQLSYKQPGVTYIPPVGVTSGTCPFPDFAYIEDMWSGGQYDAWIDKATKLAKATMFKWYRVCFRDPNTGAPFPAILPHPDQQILVWDINDLLPLDSEQVQTELLFEPTNPNQTSERTNKPAWVYGLYYWNGSKDDEDNTTALTTNPNLATGTIEIGYDLDVKNGIVKFSDYVYREVVSGATTYIMPAWLWLRTACYAQEEGTRAPLRYVRWRNTGAGSDTLARVVRHDEIRVGFYPTYDSNHVITNVNHNLDDVRQECDYYIDAMAREYQTKTPQVVRYIGLKRIELDGAIQQISYIINDNETTTIATRNTEKEDRVITYKERRQLQKQKKLNEDAEKRAAEERKARNR